MEIECLNSHNKCSSNTPYTMLQLSEIDSLTSQIRTGDTHVLTFLLIISCFFPIIFSFLFSYQQLDRTFSVAFLAVFFLFFERNHSLSLFSILTFSTFFSLLYLTFLHTPLILTFQFSYVTFHGINPRSFLKILHTYQKEQRGIKDVLEQVTPALFPHPIKNKIV